MDVGVPPPTPAGGFVKDIKKISMGIVKALNETHLQISRTCTGFQKVLFLLP